MNEYFNPDQEGTTEAKTQAVNQPETPVVQQAQPGNVNPYSNSYNNGYNNGYNGQYYNYYDYYQQQQQDNGQNGKKPKKSRKGFAVFAGIMASVLIVSVVGFSTFAIVDLYSKGLLGSSNDGTSTSDAASSQAKSNLDLASKPTTQGVSSTVSGAYTAQEVNKKVRPSVVGVITYTQSQGLVMQELGEGSGIIMSADGYIITNAHVVEGASAVKVVLSTEKEYEAKIIGSDTKTDLAVLKIEETNLPYATFGNSDEVEIGEDVVAIGNPAGLSGSLTKGIVSGLNRKVSSSEGSSIYALDCIQVDAAINPGNSGGALVNMFGQVIGINSSKYVGTDYEGIGFSISINEAKPILDSLIADGYVKDRVRIGISYQEITEVVARSNNVPTGLYVLAIDETCDVANSGLKMYDIITKINGTEVKSGDDVVTILTGKKAGDVLKLTVYRQSVVGQAETLEFNVKLEEDKGTSTESSSQQNLLPRAGQ